MILNLPSSKTIIARSTITQPAVTSSYCYLCKFEFCTSVYLFFDSLFSGRQVEGGQLEYVVHDRQRPVPAGRGHVCGIP